MVATISPGDYQTIVEHAPFMIWRSNAAAACDYFNQRWLLFTGRSLAEEIGDGWLSGVHPDDRDRCLQTYLDAFARREVFEMEYRLQRHDGEYRWIFDRGAPVVTTDGHFTGYVGSCVDVTARVVAEQARAAASAREVRTLQALLPICAWCKRIRNDQGYWSSVETYLRDELATEITHALCPACQQRL